MIAATKVSTCLDCDLALLGERLRCPACHARHATAIVAAVVLNDEVSDDDETTPHPRFVDMERTRSASILSLLTRWIVAVEVIGIVALAMVLLVKGCRG